MLFRTRLNLPRVLTRVYRSLGGLWFPDYDFTVEKGQNAMAYLTRPWGDRICIPASNLVTTAGDVYYAEMACASAAEVAPTNEFGRHTPGAGLGDGVGEHYCATNTTGIAKGMDYGDFTLGVAGSNQDHDAAYPKVNDDDSDNTGAGAAVITYRVSYTAASFEDTDILYWVVGTSVTTSTSPILTGFAFAAAFDKSLSDTLKVFVNHTVLGS